MNTSELPVAVIGAGPVGLAAAAHLLAAGHEPIVFEAGSGPGAAIAEWSHVRLFSPWAFNVDGVAASLLAGTGWVSPAPDTYPTGRELVDDYLAPLAELDVMAQHIRFDTRVTAISRDGLDKLKTAGRHTTPFRLRTVSPSGETDVLARAVIDASGTWGRPNPAGAAGVPALGEQAVAGRISYRIPDVKGADRERFANRRVLVIGSGHSAFNVLGDLADIRRDEPLTEITWAVRRPQLGQVFGGGENDALAERGRLGERIRLMVESGDITVRLGAHVDRFEASGDHVVVISDGVKIAEVDEVVVVTGFRPDLSLLSELRLDLDPALEAPSALAPLIDPNQHSCGTVRPHGAEELQHRDEPGLYIVGMKSYGRAPTALMLTGYEQVRSVVAALSGDWDAARDVRLVLPETGVCTLDAQPADEPATVGGCCG
jgi:thioredoxin reductase